MNLHILKNKNNKYSFAISGLHDAPKSGLFPSLFQSYDLACQAEFIGRKYLKVANTILKFAQSEDSSGAESDSESGTDTPIEDTDSNTFGNIITDHYFRMLESLNDRYNGIKEDLEARKDIYSELKLITQNLLQIRSSLQEKEEIEQVKKIISHYSQFAKEKFQDLLNEDLKTKKSSFEKFKTVIANKIENFPFECFKDELLEDMAVEACLSIQNYRKDAVYILDKVNKKITIASSENPIKYLSISLDENYKINNVISLDPFCNNNDFSFYQNYLKPLNSKFNNISIAGKNFQGINLPELPNESKGEHLICDDCEVSINFDCVKNKWASSLKWIKASEVMPTSFKEEDFINAKLIKCIDPELDSIYNQTGTLIQVVPMIDHIELDVDFGHQVIRLSENQIKIINEI